MMAVIMITIDVRRSGPTKRDGESLKEIELHHRE